MSSHKSFPPIYTDPAEQASEHLRRVIPLINKYKTPVNPVNYAVWYEYVSGENTELQNEIDTRLSNNQPITEQITQTLYQKYVLLDMPERLEKANNGIKLVVDNTLDNISKAGSTASHCAADLTDTQGLLDNCTDIDTLKTVVSTILSNTRTLTETSYELKAELERSSGEISKLKTELAAVKKISRTDGLTGLLNRSTFDQELQNVCHMHNTNIALVLFDLDHFKQLNDRLGHLVGDRVLQYFSSLLLEHAGSRHIAARFGGEEMVMILFDVSHQQTIEIANTIRAELANSNLKHRKDGALIGQVTVSIGISFFQAGDTPSSFIDRADRALYLAKGNGRNQIKIN
jgi:diguanylate cyclase